MFPHGPPALPLVLTLPEAWEQLPIPFFCPAIVPLAPPQWAPNHEANQPPGMRGNLRGKGDEEADEGVAEWATVYSSTRFIHLLLT